MTMNRCAWLATRKLATSMRRVKNTRCPTSRPAIAMRPSSGSVLAKLNSGPMASATRHLAMIVLSLALLGPGAALALGDAQPLPEGAVARLGTPRFNHGDHEIAGVAVSPDGKMVVSGRRGQMGPDLCLWE